MARGSLDRSKSNSIISEKIFLAARERKERKKGSPEIFAIYAFSRGSILRLRRQPCWNSVALEKAAINRTHFKRWRAILEAPGDPKKSQKSAQNPEPLAKKTLFGDREFRLDIGSVECF